MSDNKSNKVKKALNENKEIENRNVLCCNCGKSGHVYKKCFNPITSIGIICFKNDDLKSVENILSKKKWKQFVSEYPFNCSKNKKNSFKFLLIRRKDSLSFSEFVRVKYNINDINYIKKMLGNMSKNEQEFLRQAKTSDEIWNRLWTSKKKSRTRINEYNRVKKKLTSLINGTHDKYGKFFNIRSLLEDISTYRTSPEWGFPKGRRFPKESNVQCAIREFCEETDIKRFDINILKNIGPVEETFTGSNNVSYKHIYYIAELKNDIDVVVNPNNIHQKAEIGDIQWFDKDKTIDKLERKNKERVNIFSLLANYLNNLTFTK